MAEVLVEFDTIVTSTDESRWTPRACGRSTEGGLWEGWLEFTPAEGGAGPVRTERETIQPNRDDLMYWAQGLTQVYFEGALSRALRPLSPPPPPAERAVASKAFYDGPAPHLSGSAAAFVPRPVLNPFEVYRQGQSILAQELSALSLGHLRDIAVAFGFADPGNIERTGREELMSMIITSVRGATTRAPAPDASEASRDTRSTR